MVCQQRGNTLNHYYFAWGAGDQGWQEMGSDLDIILTAATWNHVVISADHSKHVRSVSI